MITEETRRQRELVEAKHSSRTKECWETRREAGPSLWTAPSSALPAGSKVPVICPLCPPSPGARHGNSLVSLFSLEKIKGLLLLLVLWDLEHPLQAPSSTFRTKAAIWSTFSGPLDRVVSPLFLLLHFSPYSGPKTVLKCSSSICWWALWGQAIFTNSVHKTWSGIYHF